MTGTVLSLENIITMDSLGCQIAQTWHQWDIARAPVKATWMELRRYIYATDTTQTTNAKLPWKNKTTVPKICQIRDNLYANYMATLFPKRKNVIWMAANRSSSTKRKREAITNYMTWVMDQERFRTEVSRLVLDYIDYGNAFATVEWIDERVHLGDGKIQGGYVGPALRRIAPPDIVFNPTADTFQESPKIVRSIVSIGELRKMLEMMSTDENRQEYEDLYKYLLDIRYTMRSTAAELQVKDDYFSVDGFGSFRQYLESDFVEILTFYGDIFVWENKEFLQNHCIMVVDRHKVIGKKPNPSYFGHAPIYHVGWRMRQDNLWAMGPLDNLIGMQYRIDHIENLKADVFDLITFPPLKIKGYVEDFDWAPMEKIKIGDDGSDVEMLAPPFQILQANVEIQELMNRMEEMAGSPKEAMGFRSPGEKTAFEVQRLENAASRIYQQRTTQFESQGVERWLNAMLELGRRNLTEVASIPVFDNEFKIQVFKELVPDDLIGVGSIKPVAARNFAEKSEIMQNLSTLSASPVWALVAPHTSGIKMTELIESNLDLGDYELFQPYVQIAEQQSAQKLAAAAQEQLMMEIQTPSGLTPDDFDEDIVNENLAQSASGMGVPPEGAG